ncbi:MAG: hypothetical protein M3065_21175 [Actinomycetota bacterium]|nr:hypothetical protein [Actinomycetota bacterium]
MRAYIQPKTSALAALSIATKLTPGQLALLNADQVDAGRRWDHAYNAIDLGDRTLAVPAASLFLRAHLVDRDLRDIGRALVSGWSSPAAQQHGHWMRRRGLTLQPL